MIPFSEVCWELCSLQTLPQKTSETAAMSRVTSHFQDGLNLDAIGQMMRDIHTQIIIIKIIIIKIIRYRRRPNRIICILLMLVSLSLSVLDGIIIASNDTVPARCTPPPHLMNSLLMLEASCCVSNGVFVSVLWRLLLESSAWPRVSLRASAQCQGWSSPWARGPGSCSAKLGARCAGVPSCPRALLSSAITRSRPTSSTLSTCHPWATP